MALFFRQRRTAFLFEILGSLFSFSERTTTVIVTVLMAIVSLAFATLGGAMIWRLVAARGDAADAILAVFFFAMAIVCALIVAKGVQAIRRPPSAPETR